MNKKIKTIVTSSAIIFTLAAMPVSAMAAEQPGTTDKYADGITESDIYSDLYSEDNGTVFLQEDYSGSSEIITAEGNLTKETSAVSLEETADEDSTVSLEDVLDEGSETLSLNEEEEDGVEVEIGNFSLDITNAVMATGSVLPLRASELAGGRVLNNEYLTWSSSDENVAVVDGAGFVTAKSYGTATITAQAANGKKASCKISTRFYDVNGSNKKKDDEYQYYYDAVYWGADNGITKGYDGVYFGPKRNCERREMLIFLWRKAGCPEKDDKGKAYGDARKMFNDLSDYGAATATNKAIAWACKEGITKGYDDGGFHPVDSITRKDALILIYRMVGKPRTYTGKNPSMQISFEDVLDEEYKPGSDTYRAILWAQNAGITNGYDDGSFKPLAECLREHIITFLYRVNNTSIELSSVPQNAGLGQKIVDFAASWVGVTPYVWAGRSLAGGTDCSGFVNLIFTHFDIPASPASDDYQSMDIQITYDELLPGDVVVYRNGGHVGIYAGEDQIIHCANERLGTIVSSLWYDTPTAYVRLAY